jgi:hypothetical protein
MPQVRYGAVGDSMSQGGTEGAPRKGSAVDNPGSAPCWAVGAQVGAPTVQATALPMPTSGRTRQQLPKKKNRATFGRINSFRFYQSVVSYRS